MKPLFPPSPDSFPDLKIKAHNPNYTLLEDHFLQVAIVNGQFRMMGNMTDLGFVAAGVRLICEGLKHRPDLQPKILPHVEAVEEVVQGEFDKLELKIN